MSHLSKSVRSRLFARGVVVLGLQAIPDMTSAMPYANPDTGYVVNDNGTVRVLRLNEVLAIAK